MSLCLMLLLAVIAINWWHGWKPFTHRFQMPGDQWLKRLSTIHSQRRRSTRAPDRSSTRESRRAWSSAALTNGRVDELHELMRSRSGIDLLKDFSEVAREELRAFTTL